MADGYIILALSLALLCRYVRDLLGPITNSLATLSKHDDLQVFAQQPDVIMQVRWVFLLVFDYYSSSSCPTCHVGILSFQLMKMCFYKNLNFKGQFMIDFWTGRCYS